jgi:hypothetical protein
MTTIWFTILLASVTVLVIFAVIGANQHFEQAGGAVIVLAALPLLRPLVVAARNINKPDDATALWEAPSDEDDA